MANKLTLLLGAGASKPLGIPTTIEMANEFLSSTSNKFIKRIPRQKVTDIETLMKTIQKITELESNEGIALLKEETDDMKKIPLHEVCQAFKRTNGELTEYIRKKCKDFNNSQASSLFLPLLELRKRGTQITIFSTNYDTAIERVCEDHDIHYLDGFTRKEKDEYPRFYPSTFTNDSSDSITLYKLHGSVNWWSDDNRQVIFRLGLELTGVPDVRNLMIYPAHKEDVLTFPYNVLESALIVQLNRTSELIAIGHKFGDANIASAVKVALERPDFRLILVNPEAEIIKRNIFDNHPQVFEVPKKFEDWVKEDLPGIEGNQEKTEPKTPESVFWIVEEFHSYFESVLRITPAVVRECSLRCPHCGNKQYLRTESKSGELMCNICKRVLSYSLPR